MKQLQRGGTVVELLVVVESLVEITSYYGKNPEVLETNCIFY